MRTPVLLEARAVGLAGTLGGAQAVLVPSDAAGPALIEDESPLVVRDLGSALRPARPGAHWAHLELPADLPLPPSIAGDIEGVPLAMTGPGSAAVMVSVPRGRPLLGAPPFACELVVLGSAAVLVGRHDELVDAVIEARRWAGPARLLYAPGAARPQTVALLAYLGVDVFDDVQCHLEAARGNALRPELPLITAPTAAAGRGGGSGSRSDAEVGMVARENVEALRREVALVRNAIERGQLRELVEGRVRTEPWQVAALRHLDSHHHAFMAAFAPVQRDVQLLAPSRDAFHRVEVRTWVDRMFERYSPPPSARVLVLLPCSARKPYSRSRTHRGMLGALSGAKNRWAVHEVILTSPLGAVPRELERVYPAAHYDVPVTGEWFPEEVERMEALFAHVRRVGGYTAVVSHMGRGLPFLESDPTVTRTREAGEGPLDGAALERLTQAASRAASQLPHVPRAQRDLEDLASLARFQFGPAGGAALMEGARLAGKPPEWRIASSDGRQLAALTQARGILSLTVEGAERVASAGCYRVLMDDFDLRGNLFAVGVSGADPEVREGDDVAIVRRGRVVGVGVAKMAAEEMVASKRGIAVATRHKAGGGGA
jgi:archaeosine synthase